MMPWEAPTKVPCPACSSPIAKPKENDETTFYDPSCALCGGLGLVTREERTTWLRANNPTR